MTKLAETRSSPHDAADAAARRARRAPAWLVGDWLPLLRDPADLLRAALLAGSVVVFATGHVGGGLRLALTFLVTLVPRALSVPRPFDFAFALGMSFQAWGNVANAFTDIGGYDKVVHYVLPAAVAPLLYLILIRLRVVPDMAVQSGIQKHVAMVLIAFTCGFTAGGIYELYEWFDNHALGGHKQVGYDDTIGDLGADALGALSGGLLLVVWDVYGWGTRRRVPRRRR